MARVDKSKLWNYRYEYQKHGCILNTFANKLTHKYVASVPLGVMISRFDQSIGVKWINTLERGDVMVRTS